MRCMGKILHTTTDGLDLPKYLVSVVYIEYVGVHINLDEVCNATPLIDDG